jgi:hypothetical protein
MCNCVSSVSLRLCLNQSVLLSVLLLYDVGVTGALSSEVSALAYRAVPTTVGYHVTSATWLQHGCRNIVLMLNGVVQLRIYLQLSTVVQTLQCFSPCSPRSLLLNPPLLGLQILL